MRAGTAGATTYVVKGAKFQTAASPRSVRMTSPVARGEDQEMNSTPGVGTQLSSAGPMTS